MQDYLELGYIGLFAICFLSASIIPIGSEVYMTFMFANNYNYLLVVIIATIGNSLGAMSCYYIGWLGKLEWLEKYFKVKASKVLSLEEKVNKYGSLMAVLSWLPFVGDAMAVALGFFKVPFIPTAFYLFIGKAARYIVWGVISYYGIELFSF